MAAESYALPFPHVTIKSGAGYVECRCGATWSLSCHLTLPSGKVWGRDCIYARCDAALAAVDELTRDLACCHLLVLTEAEEEAKDGTDVAVLAAEAYEAVKAWAEDVDMRIITAENRAAKVEAERDRLRDERDELRATCDNERGEGAPPSEGWRWNPHTHYWFSADAFVYRGGDGAPSWWWSRRSPPDHRMSGGVAQFLTARAAMIAADAAGAKS
jgi:hypothetical protein